MPRSPFITLALAVLALPSLVGAQSTYTNPVDGKTYSTDGKFKTYQPAVPRDQSGQRVKTEGVTLLTGEQDLEARTTPEDIAAFIRQAETRAVKVLVTNKGAATILIQFNCQPNRCVPRIASDGGAPNSILQSLHDSLVAIQPLRTSGEVIFQLKLKVDA